MKRILLLLSLVATATMSFAQYERDTSILGVVQGKPVRVELAECEEGDYELYASGLPSGLSIEKSYDEVEKESAYYLCGTTSVSPGTYGVSLWCSNNTSDYINLKVVAPNYITATYSGSSYNLPVGLGSNRDWSLYASARFSLTLNAGSVTSFTYYTSFSSNHGGWERSADWSNNATWHVAKVNGREATVVRGEGEDKENGYHNWYANICIYSQNDVAAYVGYYQNIYNTELYIWEENDVPGAPIGVTVTFPTYNVEVNTYGSGTVSGAGSYESGKTATLTATPAPGYVFTGWSGSVSGTENPKTITVYSDMYITATFEPYFSYERNTSIVGVVQGKPVRIELAEAEGGNHEIYASGLPYGLYIEKSYDEDINETEYYLCGTTDESVGTYEVNLWCNGKEDSFELEVVAPNSISATYSGSSESFPVGLNDSRNWNIVAYGNYKLTLNAGEVETFTYYTGHNSQYGNWSQWTNWSTDATWYVAYINGKKATVVRGYSEDKTNGYREWYADICIYSQNDVAAYVGYYQNISNTELYIWEEDNVPGAPIGVTITWPATKYTVEVNTSGYGTVTGAGSYESGKTATLTATPASGYIFTGWSGDLSGTENPKTITVSKNMTVTANFARVYDVTVDTYGPGTVTGAGSYAYGTAVTLTATPASGYVFAGWSGAVSGTENPKTITVYSDMYITATFEPYFSYERNTSIVGVVQGKPVRIELAEAEGGNHEIDTYGLPYGLYIEKSYDSDANETEYYLCGTTDESVGTYEVNLWCNGKEDSFELEVVAPNSISATYSGSSESFPVGLNDSRNWNIVAYGNYKLTLNAGEVETFTYYTGHNSQYGNWSQWTNWSTDATWYVAYINGRKATVVRGYSEDTTTGYREWYADICIYSQNDVAAYVGYYQNISNTELYIWEEDNLPGTPVGVTVTVPATKYTVTVNTNGSGTVAGAGSYESGKTATLTATPASGYIFTGWSGDISGAENPKTITVSKNMTITATFEQYVSYERDTSIVGVVQGKPVRIELAECEEGDYELYASGLPYGLYIEKSYDEDANETEYYLCGTTDESVGTYDVTLSCNGKEDSFELEVVAPNSISATYSGSSESFPVGLNNSRNWNIVAYGNYKLTLKYGNVETFTYYTGHSSQYGNWSQWINWANNATWYVAYINGKKATVVRGYSEDTTNGYREWYADICIYSQNDVAAYVGYYQNISNTELYIWEEDNLPGAPVGVTATFPTVYTVTVNTSGSGTVTGAGECISGETVTLTATPASGYVFTGWSGDLSGAENPKTITVSKNMTITATFEPGFAVDDEIAENEAVSDWLMELLDGKSGTVVLDTASGTTLEDLDAARLLGIEPTFTEAGDTISAAVKTGFEVTSITVANGTITLVATVTVEKGVIPAMPKLGGTLTVNVKGALDEAWNAEPETFANPTITRTSDTTCEMTMEMDLSTYKFYQVIVK